MISIESGNIQTVHGDSTDDGQSLLIVSINHYDQIVLITKLCRLIPQIISLVIDSYDWDFVINKYDW